MVGNASQLISVSKMRILQVLFSFIKQIQGLLNPIDLDHNEIRGEIGKVKHIRDKSSRHHDEGISSDSSEEYSHFGPLKSSPLQLTWRNVNVVAHGSPGICGLSKKGEDKQILRKFTKINFSDLKFVIILVKS